MNKAINPQPSQSYFMLQSDEFEKVVTMLIKNKELINVKVLDVHDAVMNHKNMLLEFETVLDAIYFGMKYATECRTDEETNK